MNKIILALILISLLIGCNSFTPSTNYFGQNYPDSIPIIFAPEIVSMKGRLEHGISFSPDTRELAFGVLNKDDHSGKILYSKRINENWTEPMVFEPLKSECVYLPYFSPDGRTLLYSQSQPNTENIYTDIGMVKKNGDGWSSPKVIQNLSSSSREANASMTYDGTIYFSSNRNCEGKENCHTADLFYSKLREEDYKTVNIISEFISSNDEESVFISPKEDYIIFCRHTDNETWVDLYISYRDIHNNWIEPQIIDPTINSKDWERRPFVSIDNNYLFFTRLEIGEEGLTESDIYWVNTSKLFKPFVYHSFPGITVQVGEPFEIFIPKDYFKDVNDRQLIYSINKNQYEWLNFDPQQMKLSGLPSVQGDFELTFTATDKFSNMTNDKFIITVKK